MRDIKGYEGLYAITSCGKVWSYKRKKFLKPLGYDNNYKQIDLTDSDYKRHTYFIHRLVAMAYLPNPDNLPEVNHKDEHRDHNWLTNLEWCTKQYNMTYGARVQRMTATRKANKTAKSH